MRDRVISEGSFYYYIALINMKLKNDVMKLFMIF